MSRNRVWNRQRTRQPPSRAGPVCCATKSRAISSRKGGHISSGRRACKCRICRSVANPIRVWARDPNSRGIPMASRIVSAAAIDAWMRMLDQVQASIARALDDLAEHERALDGAAAGVPEEPIASEHRCLGQFDERLRNLQSHVDDADDATAQVEELLLEDEREVRTWLDQTAAARGRLAGTGALGIS